jgi:arylsulfatase A-like enzyme
MPIAISHLRTNQFYKVMPSTIPYLEMKNRSYNTSKLRRFSGCILMIAMVLASLSTFGQDSKKLNTANPVSKKPNIIFVLVDDLGVGDVGVFFQNQRRLADLRSKPWTVTPHLDQMAAQGATLEQYCAAPVCAPSRASILLGQSQGHANVRDNQFDKALADNYTIGNVLQLLGYKTSIIGKWGLQGNDKNETKDGSKWPAFPLKRGFDHFLGYVRHGDGHEHYPKEGIYGKPKEVYQGYKEISSVLDKCYTGDLFTAAAKKYIIDHHNGASKADPFFMFLSYDTPHAVLELPTQGYPEGFGLKGGLQWTGKPGEMINTASGKPDSWMDPLYAKATYDHDRKPETAEVPWPDTYKRYATITKRIDNQIQDILVLLSDLGIDQNTLVVFTSDNGPSRESYLPKPNVPYSPVFFGSSGGFDGLKRDVWEGGVRTPTIAYWPGHIKTQTVISQPSISYDWLPTFLEAAGAKAPVRADGISLMPQLLGSGKSLKEKSNIYIEYFEGGKTPDFGDYHPSHRGRTRKQMQMVRLGDTVAVRYDVQSAADNFEIYDIRKDPQQINDLSKSQDLQALQQSVKSKVLRMRLPDSSAIRPYDNALIPAEQIEGMLQGWKRIDYENRSPWLSLPDEDSGAKRSGTLDVKGIGSGACVFQGYLYVAEDGQYELSLKTDGRSFLKVHDISAIDLDYKHQPGKQASQSLYLAKGHHHIKLYYQRTGKKDNKPELRIAKKGSDLADISTSIFNPK